MKHVNILPSQQTCQANELNNKRTVQSLHFDRQSAELVLLFGINFIEAY